MRIIDLGSKIRDKYVPYTRAPSEINTIIMHGTGSSKDPKAISDWVYDPGNEDTENNRFRRKIGLFHYMISKTGAVYRMLYDTQWAFHSNYGSGDRNTIGIENTNYTHNRGQYTDRQYKSMAALVVDLINKYPNITKIMGHDYVRTVIAGTTAKGCPDGSYSDTETYFKWSVLNTELAEYDYSLTKVDGHYYTIGPLPPPADTMDTDNTTDYSILPPGTVENTDANIFATDLPEPFDFVNNFNFYYFLNEDYTLQFTMTAGPPDLIGLPRVVSALVPGVGVSPVLVPKIKCGGKCAMEDIIFTWTAPICPYTLAGVNPAGTFALAAGAGNMTATTLFTLNKLTGKPLLRDCDIGTCTGTWSTVPPGGPALPCACSVQVITAGQIKVWGN